MIKRVFEKLLGIDKLKAQAAFEAAKLISIANEAEEKAKQAEEKAKQAEKLQKEVDETTKKIKETKLTPKERATKKKEPWVSVLNTHVNKENIRNGFFELDWNEYFIVELKRAGYGVEGDPDEEIVDRWFRDVVYNMLAESGMDTSRNAGYINVFPIDNKRSEVL